MDIRYIKGTEMEHEGNSKKYKGIIKESQKNSAGNTEKTKRGIMAM